MKYIEIFFHFSTFQHILSIFGEKKKKLKTLRKSYVQAGKVRNFTGECVTEPDKDPGWVVVDGDQADVSDIRCKEANKCNEPPYPSENLINDFDNYKINIGDSFSYFCRSEDKSKFSLFCHYH